MRAPGAGRRISVLLLMVAAFVAAACSDDPPAGLSGISRTPPLEVGAVTLPDITESNTGTPFRFRASEGELLVVYFGFTSCPDLCPTTLADLRAARRRIGTDADVVDLAFVTVDPQRDSAELLRKYVGSFAERFHVIRTTDPAALETAESAFLASSSISTLDSGEVSVSHTAATYVVDAAGTVLVEWPFGIGVAGMENDLRLLIEQLKEKNP